MPDSGPRSRPAHRVPRPSWDSREYHFRFPGETPQPQKPRGTPGLAADVPETLQRPPGDPSECPMGQHPRGRNRCLTKCKLPLRGRGSGCFRLWERRVEVNARRTNCPRPAAARGREGGWTGGLCPRASPRLFSHTSPRLSLTSGPNVEPTRMKQKVSIVATPRGEEH